MNPVYYTNYNCIENHMPQIQKILSIYGDQILDDTLQVGADSVNGKTVLFAQRDNEVFQLDSIYDDSTLVEIWQQSLPDLQRVKCMVFGFGNGMFLRELLKRASIDSLIFVYEPSIDLFRFVLNLYDLSDILSDHRLILVLPQMETPEQSFSVIARSMTDYRDHEKIRYTEYFNYNRLFPYERDYFISQITQLTNKLFQEKEFYIEHGPSYVKNQLMLTSDLIFSESMSSLKNHLPQDVTAIVVAGTATLEEYTESLALAKKHSLILSVDTAVDSLLSLGIVPDIYISLRLKKTDDILTNDRHFKIPVVCSVYTDPEVLKDHPGTVFFYGNDNPFLYQYLNREKIILPNLEEDSAVCSAIKFLEYIGIHRVILVGDNIAPGEDEMPRSIEDRDYYLPWIETELVKKPELHLINTLGTFTRIPNAEDLNFHDAVSAYCTNEFCLDSILSHSVSIFTPQQRNEYLDYVYVDYQKELLIVEEIATEIDQLCKELLAMEKRGEAGNKRFLSLADRIEENEIALEDSPFTHYPEVYCYRDICRQTEQQALPDDQDAEPDENPLRTALMQHLERNALLRQSIIDVRALLEEYKTESKKRFHALQKKKEETFEDPLIETAWRTIQSLFDAITRKANFAAFPAQMDAIMDDLQEKRGLEKFADKVSDDIRLMNEDLILQHMMVLVFLYELMRDEEYLVMMEEVCAQNSRLKEEVRAFILQFVENEPQLDPEDSLLRFAQIMGISD